MKTWVICLYLMFIYWISRHVPDIKMIFYPTLGAFSYLFITRTFSIKDFSKMIAGASVASLISSALYLSHTGMFSFLASTLCAILIIRKLKLNAPPVLTIALVPYFAEPAQVWTLPLAVLVSLSGLLLLLSLAELVQASWRADLRWWRKKNHSIDNSNL